MFSVFKCCVSENILTWKPIDNPFGALKKKLLITNGLQWFIAVFLYNALPTLKWNAKLHHEWATQDVPWRAVVVWVTHCLSPQRWSMSHPQYFQSHPSTKLLTIPRAKYLIFTHAFYVLWDLKKQSKTKTHCSSKHKSKPRSRRNVHKSIWNKKLKQL